MDRVSQAKLQVYDVCPNFMGALKRFLAPNLRSAILHAKPEFDKVHMQAE